MIGVLAYAQPITKDMFIENSKTVLYTETRAM